MWRDKKFVLFLEVIIVSNDSIFDYLHKSLITLGCKTYKVYQQSKNIYIQDFINNRTDFITISKEELDRKDNNSSNLACQASKDKLLSNIESIIKDFNNTQKKEVSLNSIPQEFKNKHNKSLSATLKSNKLGDSVIKFLKNNCSSKVRINHKNNVYYLALK